MSKDCKKYYESNHGNKKKFRRHYVKKQLRRLKQKSKKERENLKISPQRFTNLQKNSLKFAKKTF